MRHVIATMCLISLLLISCSGIQTLVVPEANVTGSTPAPIASQVSQTETAHAREATSPSVSATETSPAPLVTQTRVEIRDVNQVRKALVTIIQSGSWQDLGLSTETMQRWESFAAGQVELENSEIQAVVLFLEQWEKLNVLIQHGTIPAEAKPVLRVWVFKDTSGEEKYAVYASEGPTGQSEGEERLFLVSYTSSGEAKALVIAPVIDGFNQRISEDGEFVQYIDQAGRFALLADALALDPQSADEKILGKQLQEIYGESEYSRASTYPRFRYPFPGVEASFFGIDKSLSYQQIVLLKEALELFNRPVFETLKPYLFPKANAYVITEKIGGPVAGQTYIGTRVVVLDRRDLFGNKYELASVIAHEGSHVLQGPLPENAPCAEILKREIGDRTIAANFYNWTGDELFQAVMDHKVGAYHVSLWMLYKLGIKNLGWLQEIIRTGRVGDQSVVSCR